MSNEFGSPAPLREVNDRLHATFAEGGMAAVALMEVGLAVEAEAAQVLYASAQEITLPATLNPDSTPNPDSSVFVRKTVAALERDAQTARSQLSAAQSWLTTLEDIQEL